MDYNESKLVSEVCVLHLLTIFWQQFMMINVDKFKSLNLGYRAILLTFGDYKTNTSQPD